MWTHKKFDIGYNGKYIVDVNLTSEVKVKLEQDKTIQFTYEVLASCFLYLLNTNLFKNTFVKCFVKSTHML